MHIREICCSVDKNELTFPSFSVVFIHTFMLAGDVSVQTLSDKRLSELAKIQDEMRKALNEDPSADVRPISSLVEYITKPKYGSANRPELHFVKMDSEVEELLFPVSTLEQKQIARYSMRGFDFCIPVRASKEKDENGEYVPDFPPVDFVGHANVEVSQFFGNIFSVTYRFLFDGFTCNILTAESDGVKGKEFPYDFESKGREAMEATTNHLISLVSSCLGAEYWSDDDDDDAAAGIDLKNRLAINKIWLDSTGTPIVRDGSGKNLNPPKGESEEDKERANGVWAIEDKDRVFDKVLLRYKKFIAKKFSGRTLTDAELAEMSVVGDSRYAMVDIWETVKHPYGTAGIRDLFSDKHWPRLGEDGIINHIRDYHKPELVGLMSMYPAEWPYRAAEAYDQVCGENIAIDTDDLVLAGSHMTVVIGTYGRRGDGVNGVNWKKVMAERRFYHVSWEEYLLIVQFVLAKKYTFITAVDTLLKLSDNMSEVKKATIGECAKAALMASKKAIELDVIRHMKFPSHKVMYDRTAERLELEYYFQRFKDVQEVVSGNLQSLGEYHAAKADSKINTALIAISVVSLFELAFQDNIWPFVKQITCDRWGFAWGASVISMIAAGGAVAGLVWVIVRCVKQIKEAKQEKRNG